MMRRLLLAISVVYACLLMTACSHPQLRLPGSGPTQQEVEQSASGPSASGVIQIIDVDAKVARQLLGQKRVKLFSEVLSSPLFKPVVGKGDALELHLWEAPPATLFGGGATDPRAPSTSRSTALPEQTVDHEGSIMVPFAGRIVVAGKTTHAIEQEIAQRLKGKANQPEALVRLSRNASSTVTVVGEVANGVRMPITAGGERLLDALAAAGGVRQPVSKMTLQLTRGTQYHSLPLDLIIRDPQQNVPLQPGDVITALHQPLSFTALGATGKNEEIAFEAQGISLAQALARAGGLVDSRSNPQGLFIFRLEREDALKWRSSPVATTPDGQVPVVYRIDLRDPASFFVMQSFPISNKDVLYVSNAPAAELQKFLNLVSSVVYPVLSTIQLTR
jgi:polysaccharide biosynthesis/export protein